MTNRWAILALLFGARTVMAIQFQLVGALSPALEKVFAISAVEIGVAIGLYFAPGLVFAIPGGTIARRFGEARVAALGLWLMGAGGAVMAFADGWTTFLFGQIVAGTGGVIVNVLMTKMVADSFRDGGLALALSIFINSWPMGIALSLMLMPLIADTLGIAAAIGSVAILAAAFAMLLPLLYKGNAARAAGQSGGLDKRDLWLSLSSGVVWGCFNAGIGVVFGFGTALLSEAGMAPEAAARQTSLVLWCLALAAPLGGYLSDRFGRPELMIAGGVLALAVLILLAGQLNAPWLLLVLIGLAAAMVAGPAMSLPARSLSDSGKATGMGIFFTVYYIAFLAAPPIAGWVAEQQNALSGAFLVGALIECVGLAGLIVFARLARQR